MAAKAEGAGLWVWVTQPALRRGCQGQQV
ncbi:hypothetical protein CCACVL1_06706 [Corchorus capsularis]|uniref:Uncharacterized protein n=1 Tax=Corchorus capsularis TaxID=210143 RepID=A0A1R3JDQ9_COCAP|nr:hypothetical protein CCACVL1_06706 [Corchorus capsularis]